MRGFYVSAGLIEDSQHQERIGPALWEFLWLISHETKDAGKVLNGSPVTAVRIAADLGRHVNTVRVNLARLEKHNYIVREMGQSSVYHFRISNTKKWQHPTENSEAAEATTPQKTVSRVTENCEPASQKTVSPLRKIDKLDSKTKIKSECARPTLEQVRAYCKERNNGVDPQKWLDHYSANGWKVGRNPMKDWEAAVRTWENNGVNKNANRAQRRQADNLAAAAEAKRDFGLVS